MWLLMLLLRIAQRSEAPRQQTRGLPCDYIVGMLLLLYYYYFITVHNGITYKNDSRTLYRGTVYARAVDSNGSPLSSRAHS